MAGLFITSSRIGDAVMTLSLLEGLRVENPNMTYAVAADPLVASLFEDDPACIEIIHFPKKKASLHWFFLWKKAVKKKWDWVADTRGSIVSYLLNSKKRFIWKKTPNDKRHKVEQVSAIAGLTPITPKIILSEDRKNAMQALLPNAPIFVIAPVANWIGKQWPIHDFKEIMNRFCETYPDAHILVITAPSEDPQLTPLRTLPGSRITFSTDLAKMHDLKLIDMAALIAQGNLFLGNDSGLMHMSYALNTPVIGLFGPSRDRIYGPYPTNSIHTVIRIPKSYDELFNTPGFSHKKQECYMDELKFDHVWDVIKKKWKDC
ncbi:MAG: glycosyltransferase family 9 protein [Candidatus Paracaedibacteraceae bacterium]|nr:glycosyltransferase family 9 protein [Candidatus Paracaedibacteraceae bacterium]